MSLFDSDISYIAPSGIPVFTANFFVGADSYVVSAFALETLDGVVCSGCIFYFCTREFCICCILDLISCVA